MSSFGGTVKLTGEQEYRNALKNITSDLKNMSSALKSQTAEFNNSDSSIRKSQATQKQLTDTLNKQQEAIAKAKNSYSQYSVALQAQQVRHNALNKEYKNAVTELDRIAKASGTTSQEYKNQEKVVDELGTQLAESSRKMDENKSAMSELKKEINTSQKVIDDTKNSMNGLGNEEDDLKNKTKQTGDGFTVFKGVLANLYSKGIELAITGIKDLGAKIVDIGKQAVQQYSEFEQLEGGVKKLFGDSYMTVINNANKGFKTAGMSANEYMNTVTSFSASLISGLHGDTAKAAQIADMAIKDMSDNANTFGTDMASIQYAYQGFAKQNYTINLMSA